MLGIALTDTFGTPNFLKSFRLPVPELTTPLAESATLPSTIASSTVSNSESLTSTEPPIGAHRAAAETGDTCKPRKTYAQVFTGVRQDSGDPADFVKLMRKFYDDEGIRVDDPQP